MEIPGTEFLSYVVLINYGIPHSHHVYVCRQGDSKLKALYVMNDDSFPEVEEFVGQSTTRFVE